MHKYLALIAFLVLSAAVLGNLVQNRPRASGGDTIKAQWVDNANDEDGYRVYWDTAPATYGSNSGDLAANSTTYTITGLTPSTLYYGKTVAYKDVGGESAIPLTWQMYTTDAGGTQLPAPTVNGTIANQTDNEGDTIATLSTSTAFVSGSGETYSIIDGALPAGLSIASATGDITGTITAGEAANSPFSIRVRCTDAIGRIVDQAVFTWTVNATTLPDTGTFVAAYDFADATDSHASFDADELNSPTYTAGPPSYVTTVDGAPDAYLSQDSLDSNFMNSAGDWSVAIKFRGYTGVVNGDRVLYGNGGRTSIRYDTSGIEVEIGAATGGFVSSAAAVLNTWHVVILVWDNTSGELRISVDDGDFEIESRTGNFNQGNFQFGAFGTSDSNNFDIDYLYFFDIALTASHKDAINAATDLTYSDFPAP